MKNKRFLSILLVMLLVISSAFPKSSFATAPPPTPPTSPTDNLPDHEVGTDENSKDDKNISFYRVSSAATAYYEELNNSEAGDEKFNPDDEKVKGLLIGNAASLVGFKDPKLDGGLLGGTFSTSSMSSQSRGYKTNNKEIRHYLVYGHALNKLGLDETANENYGSIGSIGKKISGGIYWLAYMAVSTLEVVTKWVYRILRGFNPFTWFAGPGGIPSSQWSDQMNGGNATLGMASIQNFVSRMYSLCQQYAPLIVLPFMIAFIGIMFFVQNGRGTSSRLKNYFIRIFFIFLGIPLMSAIYAFGLQQIEDMQQNSLNADGIVSLTFMDFERWVKTNRLGLPSDVTIQVDGSTFDAGVISSSTKSPQKISYALAKANGILPSSVNINQSSDDYKLFEIDDKTKTQGKGKDIIEKYMSGAFYTASDFETDMTQNMSKDAKKTYGDHAKELSDVKNWREKEFLKNDKTIVGNGNSSYLESSQPLGPVITFKGGSDQQRPNVLGDPFNKNGGLSTLGTYNYLNTVFTDSGATVYSSNFLSSKVVRDSHRAVTIVGEGILSFLSYMNGITLLLCVAILGYLYFFGMLFSNLSKSLKIVINAFPMLMGSIAGAVKLVTYTLMMVIHIFMTLFAYTLAIDMLNAVNTVLLSGVNDLTTDFATMVLGSINLVGIPSAGVLNSAVVLLLSIAVNICFMIMMIRLRKSIIKGSDEFVSTQLDKLFGTGDVAKRAAAQGLAGDQRGANAFGNAGSAMAGKAHDGLNTAGMALGAVAGGYAAMRAGRKKNGEDDDEDSMNGVIINDEDKKKESEDTGGHFEGSDATQLDDDEKKALNDGSESTDSDKETSEGETSDEELGEKMAQANSLDDDVSSNDDVSDEKEQELKDEVSQAEDELKQAKANGNPEEIANAQAKLDSANKNLKDFKDKRADAIQRKNYKKDIDEKQQAVDTAETYLSNAKMGGRPEKIAKSQAKLDEAKANLANSQQNLDEFNKSKVKKSGENVKTAQANITKAEAELKKAKASGNKEQIAKAKANLNKANNELKQAKADHANNKAVGNVDSAKSKVETAKNELRSAKANGDPVKIAKAQANLDSARQGLAVANKGMNKVNSDNKVSEAQANVTKAESELKKAQASGNKAQVAKAKGKLQAANDNLNNVKAQANETLAKDDVKSAQASVVAATSALSVAKESGNATDIKSAQSNLTKAKDNLSTAEAQSNVVKASNAVSSAKEELRRAEASGQGVSEAKDNLDYAKANLTAQKANKSVAQAKANVTQATNDLAKAKASGDSQAIQRAESNLSEANMILNKAENTSNIATKRSNVASATKELNEAIASGDSARITRSQNNLARATNELTNSQVNRAKNSQATNRATSSSVAGEMAGFRAMNEPKVDDINPIVDSSVVSAGTLGFMAAKVQSTRDQMQQYKNTGNLSEKTASQINYSQSVANQKAANSMNQVSDNIILGKADKGQLLQAKKDVVSNYNAAKMNYQQAQATGRSDLIATASDNLTSASGNLQAYNDLAKKFNDHENDRASMFAQKGYGIREDHSKSTYNPANSIYRGETKENFAKTLGQSQFRGKNSEFNELIKQSNVSNVNSGINASKDFYDEIRDKDVAKGVQKRLSKSFRRKNDSYINDAVGYYSSRRNDVANNLQQALDVHDEPKIRYYKEKLKNLNSQIEKLNVANGKKKPSSSSGDNLTGNAFKDFAQGFTTTMNKKKGDSSSGGSKFIDIDSKPTHNIPKGTVRLDDLPEHLKDETEARSLLNNMKRK